MKDILFNSNFFQEEDKKKSSSKKHRKRDQADTTTLLNLLTQPLPLILAHPLLPLIINTPLTNTDYCRR